MASTMLRSTALFYSLRVFRFSWQKGRETVEEPLQVHKNPNLEVVLMLPKPSLSLVVAGAVP